jgi:DNA-binding transcriptional LysR family regulator
MLVMNNMHHMNLAAMDLNLLRVLDALLTERQLTRAAQRVGLSQPAMSHALARLREHLGDPLFVRTPRGLVPTARAMQLATPLRTALTALEQAFAGASAFDPRVARRTFAIAAADYASFVIVPRLVEKLTRVAPHVDLWVHAPAPDPVEQLSLGDVDFVLGPRFGWRELASIHAQTLYHERFVCLVRRDHPRVKRRLDLATYASLTHVFVAPRGRPGGVVDEALGLVGLTRRVGLAVPHFLVAPHVVASSDMVVTLGARVAEPPMRVLPLKLVEAPVELPGFDVQLCWHERTTHDPAHQWLRAQVLELVKDFVPKRTQKASS